MYRVANRPNRCVCQIITPALFHRILPLGPRAAAYPYGGCRGQCARAGDVLPLYIYIYVGLETGPTGAYASS